jgi:glucosamine--fructose-6-phosphate aminotransferase (isomerizing)
MSSSPPRSGHPYHMHDAIYAQPGALRLLTRGQGPTLAAVAGQLAAASHVWLAGAGSSWHAALVGESLLARVGGLGTRVGAIDAFELVQYGGTAAPGALVAVTHRGTNRWTSAALSRARAAGLATVAVTGKASGGPDAEHVLRTVEHEASSCHTVSYTCAVAMLAALAATLGRDDETSRQLDAIPDQLALLLGQESWEELAARFGGRRRYWFVASGPNVATAYEGALKLNEAAWMPATGLGCEQFLHGPWVSMEAEDVLFLIAPPGPGRDRCRDVARVASEIGAAVVALIAEDDRELAALAAETIVLPEVPELLSPIVTVVPLQLLTYHLAVKAGANPDTMRGEQPAYGRARAVAGS